MENVIPINLTGRKEISVTEKNTAKALGSGTLEVFATPAMVCLMKNTAAESVEKLLGEEFSTVGSIIDIKHLSPSPIGAKIICETKVLSQDRAKLIFKVKAFDNKGIIGEGKHERFIINKEKFMTKALSEKS